ncbi:hypothetical protein SAMN04488510_10652 [Fervidobacterium changbaicum]|uniref:Beta-1,6-galactofuranosyltransferase n=1 Tax=Fervidobacterium changbaicum TaxID=310769 RepID=A0ABX5QSH9_9BACT|nr:hypothetical protein [Fervidobacterium changbaicum]QAV33457.1 hypothetical protein CBS1_06840 [Fervidobacterium changbaicum]SDH15388.1 hypothetical protein SAMN04488510_10652 [Fervidobacterium changbaicum]
MVYYVPYFHWGSKFNAGFKAKMDVERIIMNMGFERIDVFKGKTEDTQKVFMPHKLFSLLIRSWGNKQLTESTVVFQNGTGLDWFITPFLKSAFRKGKRIIVIHDVESIRLGRKMDKTRERSVFNKFTHAIVHSKNMADYLRNELGFRGEVLILGFFDYLLDHLDQQKLSSIPEKPLGKYTIAFAGNLAKSKFIEKMLQKLSFNNYIIYLYGKGYQGQMKEGFLELKGAFHPDELPYKLEGHFGLVWDGEEVETIAGTTGEYLKYNSPHKASLYIVSGLPLIVWKEAAIFELVREYNIGFGISNLLELDEKLSKITEDEYNFWKRNVIRLAQKLAAGKNLEELLRELIN